MSRNTKKAVASEKLLRPIIAAIILAAVMVLLIPYVAHNMGSVYPETIFSVKLGDDELSLMFSKIMLVFIFLTGICIGSFTNVLIYRIPNEISFIKGTSFCPGCGKRIMPYDLIPILSYLFLGGKCRHCDFSISLIYPVVELLGGGLALLAAWAYGFSAAALTCFLIFIVLMCISFIDAEHMIIPDGLVISLVVLCIIHIAFCWGASDISWLSRIIGFFILSLPMLVLTLLIKDAFGGGDIKLIAVCGFLLGFKLTLLAGFIAVLLGGIRGVYVKYIKKDTGVVHISFGQYICIGVGAAMVSGERIINWYLSFLL